MFEKPANIALTYNQKFHFSLDSFSPKGDTLDPRSVWLELLKVAGGQERFAVSF